MKVRAILGLIYLMFLLNSCVTYSHSKSCEPDAKKMKHYNNLQFGTAHVKALKKKR